MIEQKDYLLRLIRRIIAIIRLLVNRDNEELLEIESEESLSEILGVSPGMLVDLPDPTLLSMIKMQSDRNMVACALASYGIKLYCQKSSFFPQVKSELESIREQELDNEVKALVEKVLKTFHDEGKSSI